MVYFYDGTKQGFLTAFTRAFKDDTALLRSGELTQLPIGQAIWQVDTDEKLAKKAENRLFSFDRDCIDELCLLLRAKEKGGETLAFAYFKLLAEKKRPVREDLTKDCVFKTQTLLKKIRYEIHRLHGFIRFMQTESGVLYSPFAPDYDICDLLLPHFRARLTGIPIVLHDTTRKKACFYDGKKAFVAPLPQAEILLSDDEIAWQTLFKEYYKAVNIPERERIKQMNGYMPKRYQKFMTELQN
jgi:probable DNA metabolism protein